MEILQLIRITSSEVLHIAVNSRRSLTSSSMNTFMRESHIFMRESIKVSDPSGSDGKVLAYRADNG